MVVTFVAAGANMPGPYGSPEMAISRGLSWLEDLDLRLVARSRLYASEAWPDPRDPEFINAVARIETDLGPDELLARLHETESRFGRERREPNAPRTLDLDIIDYGGRVSAPGESPILPHPRMSERAFVLLPLAEVAPEWRHPATGQTIASLIAELENPRAAWPIPR